MLPTICPECGAHLPTRDESDRPSVRCPRCECLVVATSSNEEPGRVPRDRPAESSRLPRRRRMGPPPRRKSRTLLILGIIAGSLLLLCGGGSTLIWFLFLHEIDEPVTAADKEVMVTGEYAATFADDILVDAKKGVFRKVRHVDGSREMTYEYDKPENTEEPLYVNHSVAVERTPREARDAYAGMQFASKLGLGKTDDVQEIERNDLWTWGDRSRCILLYTKGQPFGQMFMGLKGRRYFVLVISGLYFNKAENIKAFLDPLLKKMDGYEG